MLTETLTSTATLTPMRMSLSATPTPRSATITDNTFRSVTPINMYNLEKTIRQTSPQTLEWAALTTGGFGGFDCGLEHAQAGTL